jgi:hypothetical protein
METLAQKQTDCVSGLSAASLVTVVKTRGRRECLTARTWLRIDYTVKRAFKRLKNNVG